MTTTVFIVVIAAAFLHALWNALLKSGDDKFVGMSAVMMGQAPLAMIAAACFPLPAVESLPYLFAGIALHVGYQIFLTLAYRIGDLSQVYPIARGVAPLIVAGVSVGFLGVVLTVPEILGVTTIGIGIISLALVRKDGGQRNLNAAALALVTGCFIAAYSLVDGLGARVSGSAIGFYGWLACGSTIGFTTTMLLWRPAVVRTALKTQKWRGLMGGSASFIAFALVIWAFTQAPIALVTALRETSIIFALLIGVFFLKERLDLAKLVSTALTLAGAAMLRFARHL
ncbi:MULTISPECIES: DMT family transporter [unclassified Roseovarius]|uniref:DMT family transporter n=1 Tax=unclassified Roseovarius TaxID=2614913 RepID=UPI00273EC9CD|nr:MULTISPECIES: DMT family transporter [unclassified Roseovarius]